MTNNTTVIQTAANDKERAAWYKERLASCLRDVCAILTEAKQTDQIVLGFGIQYDAMGNAFVAGMSANKEL